MIISNQVAAVEGMKRFSGDPIFRFFYGVALVLEGRTQEGIRELDPLQQFSEVQTNIKKSITKNLSTVRAPFRTAVIIIFLVYYKSAYF